VCFEAWDPAHTQLKVKGREKGNIRVDGRLGARDSRHETKTQVQKFRAGRGRGLSPKKKTAVVIEGRAGRPKGKKVGKSLRGKALEAEAGTHRRAGRGGKKSCATPE